MKREPKEIVEEKLDDIISLLRQLVAIELADRGVTQAAIGKSMRVAKATVVKMLAGAKKERSNDR